jgi:hypothetical protein
MGAPQTPWGSLFAKGSMMLTSRLSFTQLVEENRALRDQVERERQRATLAEHRAQLAEEVTRQAWRLTAWTAPEREQG